MDGKAHGEPHGAGGEPAEPPTGPGLPTGPEPPTGPGLPDEDAPGLDIPAMDLETLRTADHPVLAELVSDLRERLAAPGSETLWGFDNDITE